MLDISVISNFLSRLQEEDFNCDSTVEGSNQDDVIVYDPDYDFEKLKALINNFRPYRNSITSSSLNGVIVTLTIFPMGLRTDVDFIVKPGNSGVGTVIEAVTRSVQFVHRGQTYRLPSFALMNKFMSNIRG